MFSTRFEERREECHAGNYGLALFRTRRGADAKTHAVLAGNLAPANGRIQRNTGVVLDSQNLVVEAGRAYALASTAFAASGEAKLESKTRAARGWCVERLGKTDEALAEYERAVALDPDNFNAKEDVRIVSAKVLAAWKG